MPPARRPAPAPEPTGRRWLVPLVLAVPLGVIAWWWADSAPPSDEIVVAPPSAGASVPLRPVSPFGDGPAVVGPDRVEEPAVAVAPPPPGASATAATVLPAAFQAQLQRFDQLSRQGARSDEILDLADLIDTELPERLAARELTPAQAEALKWAVLNVLESDPTARQAQFTVWRESMAREAVRAATQPGASGQGVSPQKLAEFRRREAELVAAHQALPPDQRDPLELQSQIDDLRAIIFEQP